MEPLKDIQKVCKECETQFNINEGEQEFYKNKGFALPSRCFSCRQSRKNQESSPFYPLKQKYKEHNKPKKFKKYNFD